MKNNITTFSRRLIFTFLSLFTVFCTIITIKAATYSLTQYSSVSNTGGSCNVQCIGSYYSSGNTRWSSSCSTYNWSSYTRSAVASSPVLYIPSDTYMRSSTTVSITGSDYSFGSTSKYFYFAYSNGAVRSGW